MANRLTTFWQTNCLIIERIIYKLCGNRYEKTLRCAKSDKSLDRNVYLPKSASMQSITSPPKFATRTLNSQIQCSDSEEPYLEFGGWNAEPLHQSALHGLHALVLETLNLQNHPDSYTRILSSAEVFLHVIQTDESYFHISITDIIGYLSPSFRPQVAIVKPPQKVMNK